MLKSSQYWVVETESLEQFKIDMVNVDLPIDSNMMVFAGSKSEYIEVYDVYWPNPKAGLRFLFLDISSI